MLKRIDISVKTRPIHRRDLYLKEVTAQMCSSEI